MMMVVMGITNSEGCGVGNGGRGFGGWPDR